MNQRIEGALARLPPSHPVMAIMFRLFPRLAQRIAVRQGIAQLLRLDPNLPQPLVDTLLDIYHHPGVIPLEKRVRLRDAMRPLPSDHPVRLVMEAPHLRQLMPFQRPGEVMRERMRSSHNRQWPLWVCCVTMVGYLALLLLGLSSCFTGRSVR